jgi:hypothetical protein
MGNENGPVIVTNQRLNEKVTRALAMRPNAIIDAAKSPAPEGLESGEPPATDEEAALLMAELTEALKSLRASERVPGVLVSPEDRFTSIMQRQIAEYSLQLKKVAPLEAGGLEAQFDEHDILGWAKSLATWLRRLKPHKRQSAAAIPEPLRDTLLFAWETGDQACTERGLLNVPTARRQRCATSGVEV